MTSERITLLATVIVVLTGALWGLYWLPVRLLTGAGLPGAWGTLAITASGALLLAPSVIARRCAFAAASPVALLSIALGGVAFALYSVGFVYGRVAIIILLYFLTPVWSMLTGRFVMGWPTSRMRVLAILIGVAGLFVMLGGGGEIPVPRGTGEWMALIAGILWAIGTTGMRAKSRLEPTAAAFVFALGAMATALMLAPFLDPWPGGLPTGTAGRTAGLALATGGLWWGLSVAALMWATVRLEPARVGILLMTEVLVGAGSAALLAGEHLAPQELLGGTLVLCAGVLEMWPGAKPGKGSTRSAAPGP